MQVNISSSWDFFSLSNNFSALPTPEFLSILIDMFHSRFVLPYTGCKSNVEPHILNEFSSAAYRLHEMVQVCHHHYFLLDELDRWFQEDYPLLSAEFGQQGRMLFIEGGNRITTILSSIDSLYRGFVSQPTRSPSESLIPLRRNSSEIRSTWPAWTYSGEGTMDSG